MLPVMTRNDVPLVPFQALTCAFILPIRSPAAPRTDHGARQGEGVTCPTGPGSRACLIAAGSHRERKRERGRERRVDHGSCQFPSGRRFMCNDAAAGR